MTVQTKWDSELELQVPVSIVCDKCGVGRTLSTPTAVLVAGADWVEQSEDFRVNHRCVEAARRGPRHVGPRRTAWECPTDF